jgi:hypothetical protein
MSAMDAELSAFVSEERGHFEGYDNNKFAMAFGQVLRYYGFLTIIKERYENCNVTFNKLLEIQKSLFASGGAMNEQQIAWWEENSKVCNRIQLEIESYYLFAKILLDRVARFLEFFFGPGRKLSFDSHDQMTKAFKAYCKIKELKDFEKIEYRLKSLKTDIADYRDYQISHEKSPRTMHGVHFSGTGETSIISMKMYPKDTDTQAQSKSLGKLEEDLLLYLREIMVLVRTNRGKSKLKLKGVA